VPHFAAHAHVLLAIKVQRDVIDLQHLDHTVGNTAAGALAKKIDHAGRRHAHGRRAKGHVGHGTDAVLKL
jgi:hypothetical protein